MYFQQHDSMQAFHAHLKHALAESRLHAEATVNPLDPKFERVFNDHFNQTLATMPFVNEDPTRTYSTKCIAIAMAASSTIREAREAALLRFGVDLNAMPASTGLH